MLHTLTHTQWEVSLSGIAMLTGKELVITQYKQNYLHPYDGKQVSSN